MADTADQKTELFHFALSSSPLEEMDLQNGFCDDSAGAKVVFEGRVRDHNKGKSVKALVFEAQESLCRSEICKIFKEVQDKFDVIDARCFHRTGSVDVGQMAVWIGVISAHRDDAFKACQHIIDELKQRLPVWKKEYYSDGESDWIGRDAAMKDEFSKQA